LDHGKLRKEKKIKRRDYERRGERKRRGYLQAWKKSPPRRQHTGRTKEVRTKNEEVIVHRTKKRFFTGEEEVRGLKRSKRGGRDLGR